MAANESIPLEMRPDQAAVTQGRASYDMHLSVESGVTVQAGIIDRIPPAVLNYLLEYPATVRLTLEIEQAPAPE